MNGSGEQLELPVVVEQVDEGTTPDDRPRPPTPEQSDAIERRDRDIFLRAGAGTGKTTVLVKRYAEALEESDGHIERLLAFTFTERAAAQLRSRIGHELRERGREVLARDTDRAWISTIHGFCRRLLGTHPVAAGLDPRFRVLDEPAARRLAASAFDWALEEFLAGEDRDRARLVAAYRIDGLRALIRGAHDELRSRGRLPRLPELAAPPRDAGLAELAAAARTAQEATRDFAEQGNYRPRCEQIAQAVALAERGGDPPSPTELDAVVFNPGKAKLNVAEVKAYLQALARVRRHVDERLNLEGYNALRELLDLYAERYEQEKEERSALDFEDLQIRAVELLRSSDQIRASYHERIDHLLVDEFQDTNRLQLELIELLKGPETRLFTVGDEFQSIYGFRHADVAVFRGHRDQVAAEPDERAQVLPLSGNFRALPELVAVTNALGDSLLPGFEALTVGAVPDPGPAGESPAVELLLTERDGWGDEEAGTDLDPLEGDPTQPYRVAEARFLASRLAELRDQGVPAGEMVVLLRAFTHVAAYEDALERAGLKPYVVGGHGYWEGQQVEDIRELLATLANPLDDKAVFGALSGPACAALPDTLWLLRRIAGPRRHIWPALERNFGSGGESQAPGEQDDPHGDEQAAERAAHYLPMVGEPETEKLRVFRDRIDAMRREVPRLGLEALIERLLTEFDYDLAALLRPGGRRRMANIRKLMRLAREYEATEGRDLPAFVALIREGADHQPEAATEAEKHDGVRVMSIHSVKGLEFGIVAVADLGRRLLAGARRPDIRIGEPAGEREPGSDVRVGIRLARIAEKGLKLFDYDELNEDAETEDAAEELRLAYVAATRAERRLILSAVYTPKTGEGERKPGDPVVDRLFESFGISPDTGELTVPEPEARPGLDAAFEPGRISVRWNRPSAEAAAALRATADDPRPVVHADAASAPPLRDGVTLEPAAIPHLSYSALADYGRCGYRFWAERVLGLAPRDPKTGGEYGDDADLDGANPEGADAEGADDVRRRRFAFGNAVHALLERSAGNGWQAPSAERCRSALEREGLEPSVEDVERAQRMCNAWLESDLRTELAGARPRAEVPFMLEIEGMIVRGAIDLMAELANGRRLVVDYKTNRLDGRSPEQAFEPYRLQRAVYARAAADAEKRQVETAYAFLDSTEEPLRQAFGDAELAKARMELAELITGIRAGRFEVTDRPHRRLCQDCPAREHLCSYGPELTMREAPQ